MAQMVVRYLVLNHEIPVYRIYTVGMGNAPIQAEDGKIHRQKGGKVEISLLKNGLADLNASNSSAPASGSGVTATPASAHAAGTADRSGNASLLLSQQRLISRPRSRRNSKQDL